MNWYLTVIKQYADFSGRARRMEYWMFFLFNMLFAVIAMIMDNVLGLTAGKLPYGVFYFLYTIFSLIPGMAVCVRRLHDVGKSGWMILISLIPIVGGIWLLILLFTDSQPHENEWGESPKYKSPGTQTTSLPVENTHNHSKNDNIIVSVIIWLIFSKFFWSIFSLVIRDYYTSSWFTIISIIMGLIWAIIPIILSFTINNKSKRLFLIVLGVLYLFYSLYEIVIQVIRQLY